MNPAGNTIRREITARTMVLSVTLAVLLAAANAYLGLKVGMTVSASIPAAVVAMGALRLFRERSTLESNIVQTAASAGEALAAGVIFTLPALVLLGHWSDFHYTQTALIAGLGGVLGVLFAVPLRRALLGHGGLTFPEGVATAQVLKAGESGGGRIRLIAFAGLSAAALKFLQTGLQVLAGSVAGGETGSDCFTSVSCRRTGGSARVTGSSVFVVSAAVTPFAEEAGAGVIGTGGGAC